MTSPGTASERPGRRWPQALLRWLCALPWLGALAWPAVAAGPLADPTRPAQGFAPAGDAARGHAPSAARGAPKSPAAAPDAPAAPPPQVQSIHLPQSGPPSALVDGRLVQPGDRIGDALLIAIDPDGLLLRGANGGPQRLWLLDGLRRTPPAAESRIAAAPPARSTPSPAAPGAAAADTATPVAVAGATR